MSSAITVAGETLIASAQAGQLTIDKFVLANVPGLDPEAAIDRNAGLPALEQRVYEAPVTAAGVINANTVAYSLVMGSDVGDFDFNYMALVATGGEVFAVSTLPLLSKLQGVGYNMNRNFAVSFSGAKEATGIAVSAQSWQVDYSVRLHSMDKRTTHHADDLFGVESFYNDGFKVTEESDVYTLTAGFGYVSGVRVENETDQVITVPSKPNSVWLDVALIEDFSGVRPTFTVVVDTAVQSDYTDSDGKPHYLRKIADISVAGGVTDERSFFDAVDENGLLSWLYRAKQFLVTAPVVTADIDAKYGEITTLAASGSVSAWDATDHDTQIDYYEWTLPDGSTQQGDSVDWSIPNDIGLVGEILLFKVVAVDQLGHRSDVVTYSLTVVSNKAPRVTAFTHTVPTHLVRDDVVAVSFDGATDPDGSQALLTYKIVGAVGVTASKTVSIAANESINLTVDSITADQPGSITIRAVDEMGVESKDVVIDFQLLYDPIVATPVLLSPADNATDMPASFTLVADAFATLPSGSDTHQSTDWRLTDDQDAVVWEALGETVNKLVMSVPHGVVDVSTTYKAKARFNGASYQSDWGEVTITTADDFFISVEHAKLLASGTGALGTSAALSDDANTLLLGAPHTDTAAGEAVVYKFVNGAYQQEAVLYASEAEDYDEFGESVAISADGLLAAVGCPSLDKDGVNNAGAVFVFSKAGGFWTQIAKLLPDNAPSKFGSSVAMSADGSKIVVGANGEGVPVIGCGAAYVFKNTGGNTWVKDARLTGEQPLGYGNFGVSVSISSDGLKVAVGESKGPNNYTDYVLTGATYAFSDAGGGTWNQDARLTVVDGQADDKFGWSVSFSGDGTTLAVGANYADAPYTNNGAVYMFTDNSGSWEILTKVPITESGDSTYYYFGQSVRLSRDNSTMLVHGAVSNTPGKAYVFNKKNGLWTPGAVLEPSSGNSTTQFGLGIALSADGKTALIGAAGDDDAGVNAGAGYVFK